jgi:hypothetical protein
MPGPPQVLDDRAEFGQPVRKRGTDGQPPKSLHGRDGSRKLKGLTVHLPAASRRRRVPPSRRPQHQSRQRRPATSTPHLPLGQCPPRAVKSADPVGINGADRFRHASIVTRCRSPRSEQHSLLSPPVAARLGPRTCWVRCVTWLGESDSLMSLPSSAALCRLSSPRVPSSASRYRSPQ